MAISCSNIIPHGSSRRFFSRLLYYFSTIVCANLTHSLRRAFFQHLSFAICMKLFAFLLCVLSFIHSIVITCVTSLCFLFDRIDINAVSDDVVIVVSRSAIVRLLLLLLLLWRGCDFFSVVSVIIYMFLLGRIIYSRQSSRSATEIIMPDTHLPATHLTNNHTVVVIVLLFQ